MTNPGALRSSFARIFLRSLSRINRGLRPSSLRDVNRRHLGRHRSIRIAAYASMASAVGMRRAWSHALLQRIRCGGGGKISRWSLGFSAWRRSNKERGNRKKIKDGRRMRNDNEGGVRGARKKLRRLVPGGEAMEFPRLLDETAHYIKCLRTQVEVMRSIADYYTPPKTEMNTFYTSPA